MSYKAETHQQSKLLRSWGRGGGGLQDKQWMSELSGGKKGEAGFYTGGERGRGDGEMTAEREEKVI